MASQWRQRRRLKKRQRELMRRIESSPPSLPELQSDLKELDEIIKQLAELSPPTDYYNPGGF